MFYLFGKIKARDHSLSRDNLYSMRENKSNHCMTLKNRTLKILILVSLKKIPLVKNIVKGAFFLPVLVQLLALVCADRKCESYGF